MALFIEFVNSDTGGEGYCVLLEDLAQEFAWKVAEIWHLVKDVSSWV